MAVSTSISTLASEPWTISTRTGSALAPASAVSGPNGNWVGARRLMPRSSVTIRLRYSSTRTSKPGWIGTVEPNSSTITGPLMLEPGARLSRWTTGVSTYPASASKQTARPAPLVEEGRSPVTKPSEGTRRISGLVIGPMPDTRRFTHSTCCEASPEKS